MHIFTKYDVYVYIYKHIRQNYENKVPYFKLLEKTD